VLEGIPIDPEHLGPLDEIVAFIWWVTFKRSYADPFNI
jgi:hypothetical protein